MGMGLRGFGADLGAFGAGFWGSGRKIGRQAVPGRGGFCGSPPAQGEAPPLPFGPQGFFWPGAGWGGTSVGPGFLSRQTGRSGFNRRGSKDQDDCFLGYLYV